MPDVTKDATKDATNDAVEDDARLWRGDDGAAITAQ